MSIDLANKIKKLKDERDAVILAHNYEPAEVQDISDFVGDSLELSIKASSIKSKVIIFCGVYFMAETAKILSPDKTVIMPDVNAGCPMADMLNAENLKKLKAEHPNTKVICYVNSSAEVKALSDICCTSSNSIKVVDSIKDTDEIIFVPDQYLGSYTASQVKNKKFIFWGGFCPTHMQVLPEDIRREKEKHKNAIVLVHPECRPEVIALADYPLSTGGMLRLVKESNNPEFIIGTEIGIIHRLKKENPNKIFYPATNKAICPNMKLTTVEKVLWSLEEMKTEVNVSKDIADKAKIAIDRMLQIGRND